MKTKSRRGLKMTVPACEASAARFFQGKAAEGKNKKKKQKKKKP